MGLLLAHMKVRVATEDVLVELLVDFLVVKGMILTFRPKQPTVVLAG